MANQDKSIVKASQALTRFDPKARKELVVRGLNALSEIKDADFYFFKGEEKRLNEKLKEAIAYYEKALQIDPLHEDSLFGLGYCFIEMAERVEGHRETEKTTLSEKAASAFKRLLALEEKKDTISRSSVASYYNLGIAQYRLGLYKEAEECWKRALELNPHYTNAYYNLACTQENLGIYHLALENFATFLLLVDHDLPEELPDIRYAQGQIEVLKDHLTDDYFFTVGFEYLDKGLYQETIECYEKVIELNPHYTNAYYNLALAQEELDIYHLALENFETYLLLDAYETPKTAGCVEYAEKRVEELPGLLTYFYFFETGLKYWEKNKYPEAIESYERSIELNPSFADAYYNLALALDKIDLWSSALENFKKYLIFENLELEENQRFIAHANIRINELEQILRQEGQIQQLSLFSD